MGRQSTDHRRGHPAELYLPAAARLGGAADRNRDGRRHGKRRRGVRRRRIARSRDRRRGIRQVRSGARTLGATVDFTARSYRLRVRAVPDSVDLLVFRELVRQAGAAARGKEKEQAVELLRRAEALWRGEALAEFDGDWAAGVRDRLNEERRTARRARIGLELSLGRHADLVGELHELAAERPVTEAVTADLMLALYRCGRQAEALTVYRQAHIRFRDELGMSPGPELGRLFQRMLRRDPALVRPEPVDDPSPPPGPQASSAPPVPPAPPVPLAASILPAKLPDNLLRDTPDFTGRQAELDILMRPPHPGTTSLPLTVVHGMPGAGKTALAVHAAHLLRGRFPDGLRYLDLRAHSRQPPLDPAEALATLLAALGVPNEKQELPADLDGRSSLWRELLADSRALLLFDDARDAAQIRPLLPGTSKCRVFITSRYRLAELEGAESLPLEVPSTTEAVELFVRIAGASRAADADGVRKVVTLCGRHPLAVQVAANRFRHRDAWDVADLADRLARSSRNPGENDMLPGVTGAFDLSYGELNAADQRLFRLLALHPGPDLTLHTATALDGRSASDVRRGLEELLDCHLLEEPLRDRYLFHDLLRDFAHRVCLRDDPEEVRWGATERLLDYHLAVADAADRLVHPLRRRLDARPTDPPSSTPRFADTDEAEAWLDVERSNLLAVARTAAAHSPAHARLLPHVLARSLYTWGVWQVAETLHRAALLAWGEDGHETERAQILVDRAANQWNLGLHQEAMRSGSEALDLSRGAGDPRGQAEALFQIGRTHLVAGRSREGLRCLDESLSLHRLTRNRRGEADVRNLQGIAYFQAGRFNEALDKFRAMLAVQLDIGDRSAQVWALNNMGEAYSRLNLHEEARTHYEQALALARQTGGRQETGNLFDSLGNACRAIGETARALDYYKRGLECFRSLNDPRSESESLINIGLTYEEIGRSEAALSHFTVAERVARRINSQLARQKALIGIATAQRAAGRYAAALAADREALRTARESGAVLQAAQALEGIALTTLALQGAEAARVFWREALQLYEELRLPQADSVRKQLAVAGDGEV